MHMNSNKSPRIIPVIILEDASGSTERMKHVLNEQMRGMVSALKKHEYADLVSLTAIHFDEILLERAHWEPLLRVHCDVLDLDEPIGATDTGMALNTVLDQSAAKKKEWESVSALCAAPILLMLTDGKPSPGRGSSKETADSYMIRYTEAAHRIRLLEQTGGLRFGAVGIIQTTGFRADMEILKQLTDHPERIFRAEVRFRTELDLAEPIRWLLDEITQAGEELEKRAAAAKKSKVQERPFHSEEQNPPVVEPCLDDITMAFFDLKDGTGE